MNKNNAKALSTLRQKIRKYNRDYETQITSYRQVLRIAGRKTSREAVEKRLAGRELLSLQITQKRVCQACVKSYPQRELCGAGAVLWKCKRALRGG